MEQKYVAVTLCTGCYFTSAARRYCRTTLMILLLDGRFCFGAKAGAVAALTVAAMVSYCCLEYVVARDGRRQLGSSSTDVDAPNSKHLVVASVVLDSSMIQNDAVNNAKSGESLLHDDEQCADADCDQTAQ